MAISSPPSAAALGLLEKLTDDPIYCVDEGQFFKATLEQLAADVGRGPNQQGRT